ncbi:MAG: ABC transporter ATP-binding protein [Cyanobacteria bacterium]|nr:ABC transporter ATP-binding protein [Cyanobacteriota bacterium]
MKPNTTESGSSLLLDVSKVTRHYGAQCALKDFSLRLSPGEVCGLVGSNGGGKTTALRILAGLLKPDTAQGQVLGFDLMEKSSEIRKQVGYMTQHHALYKDLTVNENLLTRAIIYDVPHPRARVQELLEQFELTPVQSKRVGSLSGGWARRTQFAASLVQHPKLLLLDEPTTGLDIHSREMFWDHIQQFANQGMGLLISTHDLSEAKACTKMAVFVQGKVVALDTPEALIQAQQVSTLEAAISILTRQQPMEILS